MSDTGITVEDLKTELRAVQNAILAILTTARSINRPGLGYTRESLDALKSHRDALILAIQRAGGGLVSALDVSGIDGASDIKWDSA